MPGRGKWRLGLTVLAICIGAFAPSSATAGDANTTPPDLELWPAGREPGLIGPVDKGLGYNSELAYFATSEEGPNMASHADAEYTVESEISFTCLLDGAPTTCEAEHSPVEVIEGWHRDEARCRRPRARKRRPRPCYPRPVRESPDAPAVEVKGPFTGEVPVPPGLTPGRHTVTVIAADEDGTDPNPPTVEVVLDLTPPSTPKLTVAPPRVSAQAKPRFKFTSTDDHGFPDRTYTSTELFDARLRRVQPPGPTLGMGDPFGNYLEWRGPFCPTPRRCTQIVFPAYSADAGGGATFGVPERLTPGLYEFRVIAADSVGNESKVRKHRFRVLRPGPR